MTRFFNTAGPCKPDIHFVLSPMRRLPEVRELIDRQSYFVLHAPRQAGKTTALLTLAAELTAEGRYAAGVVSAEAGAPFGDDPGAAEGAILGTFRDRLRTQLPPDLRPPPWPAADPGSRVGTALTAWAEACPRPVVLFIDEIDALRDDALLSVLRQLRAGHPQRPGAFPWSLALIGLRDVRDYKIASGGSSRLGTPSPFNILVKSLTLRNFTREEVAELYAQHTAETGQSFEPAALDRAFDLSRGQPWLVNALAATAVDELARDRAVAVTAADIDKAKERLIAQRQTHLDSLADKLDDPRVKSIVLNIINGGDIQFDGADNNLRYCRDLGIITAKSPVAFANPIYREIITRIMNAGFQESINQDIAQTSWYLRPDGSLDMDKLLDAFVMFYRRHSESWLERFQYKEAGHQLLLMAFLQRIINGGGRIEREMAIGNGRTDLAVFWKDQVIPIELKMNHDKWSQPEGIEQLGRYMDKLGQKSGYLILFEKKSSEELPWEVRLRREIHEVAGKEVILLGM